MKKNLLLLALTASLFGAAAQAATFQNMTCMKLYVCDCEGDKYEIAPNESYDGNDCCGRAINFGLEPRCETEDVRYEFSATVPASDKKTYYIYEQRDGRGTLQGFVIRTCKRNAKRVP